MSDRSKFITAISLLIALVAAAGVGLVAAQHSDDQAADPSQQVAFQQQLDQTRAAYLAHVRSTIPALSTVSDEQVQKAALFTCAAYGDMARVDASPAQVEQAAQGLIQYGYVPTGSRADAWQLAMATGITC